MIFLDMRKLENFRTNNNITKACMNSLMGASHNYYNNLILKNGICGEQYAALLLKLIKEKYGNEPIEFIEYVPKNYKKLFDAKMEKAK